MAVILWFAFSHASAFEAMTETVLPDFQQYLVKSKRDGDNPAHAEALTRHWNKNNVRELLNYCIATGEISFESENTIIVEWGGGGCEEMQQYVCIVVQGERALIIQPEFNRIASISFRGKEKRNCEKAIRKETIEWLTHCKGGLAYASSTTSAEHVFFITLYKGARVLNYFAVSGINEINVISAGRKPLADEESFVEGNKIILGIWKLFNISASGMAKRPISHKNAVELEYDRGILRRQQPLLLDRTHWRPIISRIISDGCSGLYYGFYLLCFRRQDKKRCVANPFRFHLTSALTQ